MLDEEQKLPTMEDTIDEQEPLEIEPTDDYDPETDEDMQGHTRTLNLNRKFHFRSVPLEI